METARITRGLPILSKLAFITTVGLISAAIAYQASAQTITTEPVGFYTTTALTNSDTFLTSALQPIEVYRGSVASVSGSSIVVNGPESWPVTTQWATPSTPNHYFPYYVRVMSGTMEGAYYTITNNDASTLWVGFAGSGAASDLNLNNINAGDLIRIYPFWTLSAMFSSSSNVVASTATTAAGRRTQVVFPNLAGTGINLGSLASYYFYNNAWRRSVPSSSAVSNFNDVVITPDQYVTVRNANNTTDITRFIGIGQVVTNKLRFPLFASGPPALGQDNYIGMERPAFQTLYQSGLSNAIVASIASSAVGRRDQVLVFDNTVPLQNRGVSQSYYFFNNGWRRSVPSASAAVDFGTSNIFAAQYGIIIRRATNGVTGTSMANWVNSPNY